MHHKNTSWLYTEAMAKKRKSKVDKRTDKRQKLLERISSLMEMTNADTQRLLSTPLCRAVRINPLKQDPAITLNVMQALGWRGAPIEWCENGYTIDEGFELLRDSDLAQNGAIYIQNTSSWLPVVALNPSPKETVLDVCAAPGGKTSHIAALTKNAGDIIANDNSKPRLVRMRRNLERLGVNAKLTLHDATTLTHKLDIGGFDKILLDAPCSGEGLVNLSDPSSLDTWSEAHIKRLSNLQKRILQQSWHLLRPGGRLVYSTCTSAPEENEIVIQWLLDRNDDAAIIAAPGINEATDSALMTWRERNFNNDMKNARRVLPNSSGAEIFFVALLEKRSTYLQEVGK